MERLGGPPITEHADRLGLDLHARLALVCDVCDAAGYRSVSEAFDIGPRD
jgi:hypothetical protein